MSSSKREEGRLGQFITGFVAASQLLNRAATNGFLIEYVCLATSVIDAALRIGLILNHQLANKNDEILEDLLFQGEADEIISERVIYKRAIDDKIIDKALFTDLETLYKERNKVIHRYIISDITTKQVLEIGMKYERIVSVINECIRKLEDEQIELGIGMTRIGPNLPEGHLDQVSSTKHADSTLAKKLKQNL